MDTIDYDIIKAIAGLKVAYPRADRIISVINIDPEELGARLGGLEMQGLVKTLNEMDVDGSSLPNGITAAGLTNLGKRALSGPRW